MVAGPETEETVWDEPTAPSGEETHPEQIREGQLQVGASVGRYVILERLGAGGMGVVYGAYDPDLDRKIALKLLLPSGRDETRRERARQRLLREAQAMARLTHPNVIAVHDVGHVRDVVFIAMEYVDGQTLRKWAEEEHDWRSRVDVMRQAGAGLAAAHAANLVHRDFKPDNVMVSGEGRVLVLDFGLARGTGKDDVDDAAPAPSASVSLDTPLTVDGSVVGTPAFMSPEQHLGLPADARSDQFSFCVAAYQCLYGERPFQASSMVALAAAVTEGTPREPPPDSPVPGHYWSVLRRGLASAPDERWPDMPTLLAALAHDPVAARKRTTRQGLMALGIVGGLAGAWSVGASESGPVCDGGTAQLAATWSPERADAIERAFAATDLGFAKDSARRVVTALDAHAEAWSAEHRATCEAARTVGDRPSPWLEERMACLEERRAELGEVVAVLESADASVVPRAVDAALRLSAPSDCARSRESDPPAADVLDEVRAEEQRLARVRARENTGRYETGLELAGEVLDRARDLDHGPFLAEALYQHARLLERTGDFERARTELEETVTVAARSRSPEVEASAWQRLLFVVGVRQRKFEAGLALEPAARAALERVEEAELLTAGLDSNLGTIRDRSGDHDGALPHHERALTIRERRLGPNHPGTAGSLTNLAVALDHAGKTTEAVEAFRRAEEMLATRLGASHPHLAIIHNNLGNALDTLGRHDEAEAAYRKALEVQRAALGDDHPDVAISLNNLGLLLVATDRAAEAVRLYREAYDLQLATLPPDHPALGITRLNLAEGLMAAGQPADALPVLDAEAARHESGSEERAEVDALREKARTAAGSAGPDRP